MVLTLFAPGTPGERPPSGIVFSLFSDAERRLFAHPRFAERYRRPAPPGAPAADWRAALAGQIGALRIFEHYPAGLYYLLAVFERRAIPARSNPLPL